MKVALPSEQEGKALLSKAPFFSGFEPLYKRAEYRTDTTRTGMPSVSIGIEQYGFYICNHGDSQMMAALVGYLALCGLNYGSIELSEIE